MRKNACFALIALVLGLAAHGCATTNSAKGTETPGGFLRAETFGGLLGALEGGALGDYSDRKEKELRETMQIHSEEPDITAVKVRIEAVRVTPSVADPGDTIDIRIKYAILTPQDDMTVPVHETREIIFEEKPVGQASVDIERQGGTWRSSVPITLPMNVLPGTYQVVASVRTPNGEEDIEEVSFRVR